MIVSTTPTLEGKRVVTYIGLVSGEAVMGANIFRDMFAAVRDIVGGQAGAYEKVLKDARDMAISEMTNEAAARGANASSVSTSTTKSWATAAACSWYRRTGQRWSWSRQELLRQAQIGCRADIALAT